MALPKITSAMLILTHQCPLHCRYCFVHQEPTSMSYQVARDAVDFLAANAKESGEVPEINYFGGEPMLMWDSIIVPLTDYIRKELKIPFKLSITTNGVLLTSERIAYMKENDIGALVSIDGAKETQDYNRPFHNGESSFDRLSPILPELLSNFPTLTLRMTTIPETCNKVFENIQWGEQTGYSNFYVVPNVFEEWDEDAKRILAEEMDKYGDYYIDCYRKDKRPIDFSTLRTSFAFIKAHNDAETNNTFRCSARCRAEGKCGLGASKFASIHPDGHIYACQEMTSNEGDKSIFCIGNIYKGVNDSRRFALMDMFNSEVATGDGCKDCPLYRICDGGCVANNYMITGSLTSLPPVYCWWMKTMFNLAVRIMQTLGAEGNARFREYWRGIK